ncbi:unnamed protein product [Allacma fusca]|uniref:Uncharacterized protein n=1 Tax=Allacma fusca TaxID=39272 RepID=A0A8J2K3Q6_9HEXA|nr:unnamed protein product [Allacma fusca]
MLESLPAVPSRPKSLLMGIFNNLKSEDDSQEELLESSIPTEIIPQDSSQSDSQIFNSTQTLNGQNPLHEQTARFLQIPNFIEAILALLISGLLLAACLLIIKKTKAWCIARSKHWEKDEETPGVDNKQRKEAPANTNVVVPSASTTSEEKSENLETQKETIVGKSDDKSGNSSEATPRHSNRSSSRKSYKSKDGGTRPNFVRRASGPFGDEAMAYVEDTYRGVQHYEDKQSSWARRLSSRRGPSSNENKRSRDNV